MKFQSFFKCFILFIAPAILFTACSEDEDNGTIGGEAKGTVEFQMTDAPADDANIKSAFVTVSEIRVDGQTWDGLNGKTTIDLLAYQNGNVEAMGLGELDAGTYSNVTLVLDYETDENGNTPGCFVETTDGVRHDLKASSNSSSQINLNGDNFQVAENSTTKVVMDFDVRKAITYEENNANDEYNFVTDGEMNAAVRFVTRTETGTIRGNVDQGLNTSAKVVAFAYKKGEYDRDKEIQGQGSSQVRFKNAVSSAAVDANGNFTLAFLEEGDYEVHFAAYDDDDNDGKFELEGTLLVNVLTSLDLLNISVDAEAEVSANVLVTGILGL